MEGAGLSDLQTALEQVVGSTRGRSAGPESDWWRWPAITVVVALWSSIGVPGRMAPENLSMRTRLQKQEEVCVEARFQPAGH